MVRIFLALSLFAVSLLVANVILGLLTGDFNGASQRFRRAQQRLEAMEKSSDALREQLQDERGRFRKTAAEFAALNRWKVLHFLFGLAAALVTVLVNSITVTYFIGTNRWCKEVVEAYRLDAELAGRSTRLKRKTFPWALAGILVMLAIVTLGGASDPSANVAHSSSWVPVHFVGAIVGTGLIAWSFFVQVVNIGKNYDVIRRIVDDVRTIRAERGLETV